MIEIKHLVKLNHLINYTSLLELSLLSRFSKTYYSVMYSKLNIRTDIFFSFISKNAVLHFQLKSNWKRQLI